MQAARHALSVLTATLLLAVPVPGQTPEPSDLTQCVGMLQKGPAAAREAAVAAAARFGADAVPVIGALLAATDAVDAETSLRRAAASRALWRIAARASAPGGPRQAVSLALLQLLAKPAALDPLAADEVLHMLSVTATDTPTVQRIADRLDDPALADAALFALRRIPGDVVGQILRQRLDQPGPLGRAPILRALGERLTPATVPLLLDLLANCQGDVAAALRDALARSGDARASEPLRAAMLQQAPGALDAWLAFLEARARAGATAADLAPQFRELLGSARAEVRAAALRNLAAAAVPSDLAGIVAALGDTDATVQKAAQQALAAWRGIDAQLLAAHRDAKAGVRGGVLQVLAVRQPAQALLLARQDVADQDATVRRAALSVLAAAGDPADTELLFAAAGDADASVRAIAARGLSRVAAERQRAGDRDGALQVLHRILAAGGDVELLRDTIGQVGRVGAPASLEVLQPLQADPRFRENVAEAQLQIAAGLPVAGKVQAVTLLLDVYEQSKDRARRRAALRCLQQRGVDAAAVVRGHGVVQDWHVLGPWSKAADQQDLGKQPFGADLPDLAAAVPHGTAALRWQPRRTDDPDGVLDLLFLRPNQNVSAFAVRTFDWPAEADLLLKLGSDDGCAVWVNGELVHANFTARGVIVDEDTVKVHFKPGANTVLVRVDQGAGDFGFCLRLCDAGGKPADLDRK